MECLSHYVHFQMWPALFYVNSHCFQTSSMDWKLRFWNVGVTLYLHCFSMYTNIQNWDIWMLLKAGPPNFSQFMKEIKNWNLQMLTNRQYFQIFPNSQRDWKLRWVTVEKGIIKWARSETWKFLTEFLILSERQISIFSSTLLSGIFTISEE